MSSDRIFGLVVVIGALAFFAGALQLQTSFLSDPVGPKKFPMIIAGGAALCGLAMLWKPDPEPHWPDSLTLAKMAAALALMIGYALTIGPLGFIPATAIAAAGISYLIEKNIRNSVLTGIGLSVLLFVIFKFGLGLGLFAFPRALMG